MTRLAMTLLLTGLLAAATSHAGELQLVQPNTLLASKAKTFTVQPPVGWMCNLVKTQIGCSRDGFMLNGITIDLRPHAKAFPRIKKTSSPDALPEELAEDLVADIAAIPNLRDVKVVAVEPAELSGQPAFRVHWTYRLSEAMGGATYDGVAVGAAFTEGLLVAQFEAPRLNYFAKWLPVFDATLPGVTVTPRHK